MDTAIEPTIENFDLFAMLEGTPLPVEEVTVFSDTKSAMEYAKLVKERGTDTDTPELDEQIDALAVKLRESALTFGIRGMAPGIVNEILAPGGKQAADPQELVERDNELIAKSIVSVTNAKGAEDKRVWQKDDVAKLRLLLNEGEFGRLVAKVAEVNFTAAAFDAATDAGFPRGRVDVA